MRHLADPRWYAGETNLLPDWTNRLPDWEGALLAIPASCLSDDDNEAIIRFVRKLIAAKSAALMALGLAVGGPAV